MVNKPKTPVFVVAAKVAAHLYFATKIAECLSLTAKNARAITARAGIQAVGFTAITAFIQEMATSTINLAQEIDKTAIKISQFAVELERCSQAQDKFNRSLLLGKQAQFIDSINPLVSANKRQLLELQQTYSKLHRNLYDLIEQTQKQIRSATAISSMSKIEASKSGSFQKQLEVIAANIFDSAAKIKTELTAAESLLKGSRIFI